MEQLVQTFPGVEEVPLQLNLPASQQVRLERLRQSQGLPTVGEVVRNAIEAYLQAQHDNFRVPLTRRQREVLRLIGAGNTTKQIADELQISIKTVEFHRKQLMKVLGARRLADLVRCSIRAGLIQP